VEASLAQPGRVGVTRGRVSQPREDSDSGATAVSHDSEPLHGRVPRAATPAQLAALFKLAEP
jgi:hypothetical protein